MSQTGHTSSPEKRDLPARLKSKDTMYGVHGGIKKFYGMDPEEEHAATLDRLAGAVGG